MRIRWCLFNDNAARDVNRLKNFNTRGTSAMRKLFASSWRGIIAMIFAVNVSATGTLDTKIQRAFDSGELQGLHAVIVVHKGVFAGNYNNRDAWKVADKILRQMVAPTLSGG